MNAPLNRLKYHVSGAIARGEKSAIAEIPARIHPYAVIVGNVGQTWSGNNPIEAQKQYADWIKESKRDTGRASGESVTLSRNGEPLREFDPHKGFFFVEMTDTFGGEANYCWVNRFKVKANTVIGAMRKVSAHTGYSGRIHKAYDVADMARYDVRGACICFFAERYEHENHGNYSTMEVIT